MRKTFQFQKFILLHGKKYNYSKTNFYNSKTKNYDNLKIKLLY